MRRVRRVAVSYLSFKGEYVDKILRGVKRATVRLGIVTPRRRELVIYGDGRAVGKVAVESVKYVRVRELTDRDALLDGFSSKRELLSALERHYPGISPDDWVTVIRFRLLRSFRRAEERGADVREVAKLALAHGVVSDREGARIMTAVMTAGNIDGAYELLRGRYPLRRIRELVARAERELRSRGLLRG
ncbi:MAG: ASCH domain-containing protein [Thermoprotei archaeon]|nr:MAG: ASCH domain-containing protein [Thermoprotei archaeon]